MNFQFTPGTDYNNVYFLKIDAKGHSTIVRSNDADKADKAFDIFEKHVYDVIDEVCNRKRCEYAQFWGWQGDGGLCILFDFEESRARETALEAASIILDELEGLNKRISREEISGAISVRIAIHKGAIRYKGDEKRGSVHSSDINWCAHLESVTPIDSIAISNDVYNISGGRKTNYFFAEEKFEGREVYLRSKRQRDEIIEEWRQNLNKKSDNALLISSDIPKTHNLIGVYSQRVLTQEYAQYIENAKKRIWVSGFGLGGFQADHRDDFVEKVINGVDVRILGAEPDITINSIVHDGKKYSLCSWKDWESNQGLLSQTSNSNLETFVKNINKIIARKTPKHLPVYAVHLRYTSSIPKFALLIIDDEAFFSTYLRSVQNSKNPTFWIRYPGRLFDDFYHHFEEIWNDSRLTRQIIS